MLEFKKESNYSVLINRINIGGNITELRPDMSGRWWMQCCRDSLSSAEVRQIADKLDELNKAG